MTSNIVTLDIELVHINTLVIIRTLIIDILDYSEAFKVYLIYNTIIVYFHSNFELFAIK